MLELFLVLNYIRIENLKKEVFMNENFVLVSVLPQTRDELRIIAKYRDTNIYKILRDFAKNECEKILKETNTSVENNSKE